MEVLGRGTRSECQNFSRMFILTSDDMVRVYVDWWRMFCAGHDEDVLVGGASGVVPLRRGGSGLALARWNGLCLGGRSLLPVRHGAPFKSKFITEQVFALCMHVATPHSHLPNVLLVYPSPLTHPPLPRDILSLYVLYH